MIAWALLWYAVGLVGHCLVEITSRAFYALHDTRTPVTVGVIAMSLNIVFSLAFSRAVPVFWAATTWRPCPGQLACHGAGNGCTAGTDAAQAERHGWKRSAPCNHRWHRIWGRNGCHPLDMAAVCPGPASLAGAWGRIMPWSAGLRRAAGRFESTRNSTGVALVVSQAWKIMHE